MIRLAFRSTLAVLLAVFAALAAAPAPHADAAPPGAGHAVAPFPWAASYDQAVAKARAERKDLVLLFTGSDWCGNCIVLEREVFHAADFARRATQQFVFVLFDFPQSPELQARVRDVTTRDRMQTDLDVQGYPTVWLTTSEGMPYATVGYGGGGPDAFLATLQDARARRERLAPLFRAGRHADAATLRATLPALDESGLLGLRPYAWVLDRARAVDPSGQLGLRGYADRIGELTKMMALFEGQASWAEIHRFLLSARLITNEERYASGLALCAEHYLLAEGRYAEALDFVARAQRTPRLQSNEYAQSSFRALHDRIVAARDAARAPLPR